MAVPIGILESLNFKTFCIFTENLQSGFFGIATVILGMNENQFHFHEHDSKGALTEKSLKTVFQSWESYL